MRIAETVTFAAAPLDRAAQLRGDSQALNRLRAQASTRVLPLWRGKPLIDAEGGGGLIWLAPDHALVRASDPAWIFLGADGQGARFAADVSAWEPARLPEGAGGLFDATVVAHPDLPAGWGFADLRMVMAGLDTLDAQSAATARALLNWHRSHGFCAACGAPSVIEQGGWQRRCPSCEAHHFPRTDPVVIMLVTRANAVLLGRSHGWPEGMYSLLAGFVEPGETIEAAVRREVAEESGVQVGAVRYLASQPWPFPASLMIGCRAEALTFAIRRDPVELDDACWVGREEMVAVMAGLHDRIRPARRGAIAHFLVANWLADRLE